ncbi:uncharacterized protein AB675_10538 [Cyphellophora attinorum]|uniref:Uncharacterized protein n=1 Tax=Cyphellophora attinorum TaxID=1664694 RepID=A0A0N1P0U8_9EURO|nr:uncharacterized protein AB675_10538 [Phialophora attinorum]KPI40636.1 hypothetical protein AB675_10538 [Phialophora attinorum]
MEHDRDTSTDQPGGDSGERNAPRAARPRLPSPPSHSNTSRSSYGYSQQHEIYAGAEAVATRRYSVDSRRDYSEGNLPSWTPGSPTRVVDIGERPGKRLKLDSIPPESVFQPLVAASSALPPSKFDDNAPRSVNAYTGIQSTQLEPSSATIRQCEECLQSADDLGHLVRSILELSEMLISNTGVSDTGTLSGSERRASEVTKHGTKYSISWAAIEARRLVTLMRDASSATAPPGILLPPLGSALSAKLRHDRRPLATSSHGSHPPSVTPDTADIDNASRRPSISHDQFHTQPYAILPPIIPPDDMKRQRYQDQALTGSSTSPHPSSGSSLYGPSYSPSQTQGPGRALPSPPGTYMPPSTLTMSATPSTAHAAHLQDLQHQISTKTLALQTLQREHDQLLSAFSRSQIRCSTLDKKSQVSDHEINNLTEEKIRLQQQVETLESQIEDLTQARDLFQKQSSAEGAQWRQMMAMSSQLQSKGAEEARLHKQEREEWQRQRDEFEKRIREIENSRPTTMTGTSTSLPPLEIELEVEDHVLESTSMDVLRNEIRGLRRRCLELEGILNDITGETSSLNAAMRAMANIQARIAGRVRHVSGQGERDRDG